MVVSSDTIKVFKPEFEKVLEGFDVTDFNRSMLLAQGQFDAFLAAPAEARAEILERLTDTAVYQRIGERAARLHGRHSHRLKGLGTLAAAGGGLDPQALFDIVTTAAGNSWMFENRMPHVLEGDETPRSAVDIFVKDLGLVGDLARTVAFPAPLAAQAHQLFVSARAQGHGAKDDAFVIRAYQALTGIRLPKD